MSDATKPTYGPHDVLTPDEVRAALAIESEDSWHKVSARIPWSTALGRRTYRIQWQTLLDWLGESTRQVA